MQKIRLLSKKQSFALYRMSPHFHFIIVQQVASLHFFGSSASVIESNRTHRPSLPQVALEIGNMLLWFTTVVSLSVYISADIHTNNCCTFYQLHFNVFMYLILLIYSCCICVFIYSSLYLQLMQLFLFIIIIICKISCLSIHLCQNSNNQIWGIIAKSIWLCSTKKEYLAIYC